MVNPIDDEQEKYKKPKNRLQEKKEKSITYTVYVRNEKVDGT